MPHKDRSRKKNLPQNEKDGEADENSQPKPKFAVVEATVLNEILLAVKFSPSSFFLLTFFF